MTFRDQSKSALAKLLSDIIQADGIVNKGETDYLRHVFHVLNIDPTHRKKANTLSFSDAIAELKKLGYREKLAILKIIQQLAIADSSLDIHEAVLLLATIMSLNIDSNNLCTAHVLSVANINFDCNKAILFVEPSFDKSINEAIERQHNEISTLLEERGMSLIYLPHVLRELSDKRHTFCDMIEYLEPTLTKDDIVVISQEVPLLNTAAFSKEFFVKYLKLKDFHLQEPSFMLKIEKLHSSKFTDFLIIPIKDKNQPYQTLKNFFLSLDHIQDYFPCHLDENDLKYLEPFDFPASSSKQNEELQYTGFHRLIVNTILKPNSDPHFSRLLITDTGKIILLDKNNIEVRMPSLCRALYILFLRHEEGIRLSELSDYRHELYDIYLKTSNYSNEERLHNAINNIVDFVGLTMNTNLSRIKKAFVQILGDEAREYLIQGEKGAIRKIHLDRKFVIFNDNKKGLDKNT